MFCPNCGREVQEGAVICGFCGASVEPYEKPDYDFDTGVDDLTEEDWELFSDEPVEPAIAWCNGNGLGKSEVIEYLENVVEIQANQEECNQIMKGLDEEYRAAESRIPYEPVHGRPAIRLKKGILGIILGLAICNIWINSMIPQIISFMVMAASVWFFFVKPVIDCRTRYAAELANYRRGAAECAEIRENCRSAYGVVRTIGDSCSDALNDLYNTEIIKPKYRNLPACAFILEQLENGLTNTLVFQDGDKGAYNKWEEQLYRNSVISNLDDIRDTVHNIDGKLDMVIENQHLLYDKVNEVNENVNRVVKELVHIKSFSALTAMNTEQMKHTLKNIAADTSAIATNTAATAWAADCAARNSATNLSQELRTKMGSAFVF